MAKALSCKENEGSDASALTKIWSGIPITNNIKKKKELYHIHASMLLLTQPEHLLEVFRAHAKCLHVLLILFYS